MLAPYPALELNHDYTRDAGGVPWRDNVLLPRTITASSIAFAARGGLARRLQRLVPRTKALSWPAVSLYV
jgi:hypothetical protein